MASVLQEKHGLELKQKLIDVILAAQRKDLICISIENLIIRAEIMNRVHQNADIEYLFCIDGVIPNCVHGTYKLIHTIIWYVIHDISNTRLSAARAHMKSKSLVEDGYFFEAKRKLL